MASAMVGSPMISCQCSTGNWMVTIVEPRPWRSSMISKRFAALVGASGRAPNVEPGLGPVQPYKSLCGFQNFIERLLRVVHADHNTIKRLVVIGAEG